jgi:hypothetical protein
MTSARYRSHACTPALTGWSAFAGMARVDAVAALITNQPRGY